MKKGKIKLSSSARNESMLDKIARDFTREKISRLDGLRIDFRTDNLMKGGWVHLRPSNTEPVFRIIAEGTSDSQAELIYKEFSKRLV